jgi:glucosamine kinase
MDRIPAAPALLPSPDAPPDLLMAPEQTFVLGIDAGGTKTVCQLADGSGRLISEARGGGANLQASGELHVEKTLHDLMEQCIGDRARVPAAICLGMAGVDRPDDAAVVRGIMKRIGYKARVLVVNDALVALEAGAPGSPGVVIISGTGSIAYGRNAAGQAARAGGWGYVLGDEGSGYWIGLHALKTFTAESDGTQQRPSSLTPRVRAELGLNRADDLLAWTYHSGGTRVKDIARLTGIVLEAAASGDAAALEILENAAHHLALLAKTVIRRLDFPARPAIAFAGGLLTSDNALSRAVCARLDLDAIPEPQHRPVIGAALLAKLVCGG